MIDFRSEWVTAADVVHARTTYLGAFLRRIAPVLGTRGLPSGRLPRELERLRRWRALRGARAGLLALLARHCRARLPALPPMPTHGNFCPPDCGSCRAIAAWRRHVLELVGADVVDDDGGIWSLL